MDRTDFTYIGWVHLDLADGAVLIHECRHCGAFVREESLGTHINFHNGANLEVSP